MKRLLRWLFVTHRNKSLLLLLVLGLWYAFCLPRPLFDAPSCFVLESREGELLGARIAADGQWRFPDVDSVPVKFEQALLTFEDRRFYSHPGVDPIGLGRAFWQNIKAGEIVSGGSTISMQVIRLALQHPPRTVLRKVQEMILASRLELGYSKEDILRLYASHAPFGGNVVGVESASWRYFGKRAGLLSWGEAAVLAVLPNSPALIHPGRNRDALRQKRNRLLHRLHEEGRLDSIDLELALTEPLPDAPHALPNIAPHLLERIQAEQNGQGGGVVRSSLQYHLQQQANHVLDHHHNRLRSNQVHNLAALILDVETGEALAYVGNVGTDKATEGGAVDVIPAPRSTGSIMKPFLYAFALQDGVIFPGSLLQDIPMRLSGYQPENYHEDYDGVVPAERALIRSLNVPIVRLLQSYGLERFHHRLQQLGLRHINQPPSHYGLPLVLGGAEASLWELCGVYASMSRMLGHAQADNGQYRPTDFHPPRYQLSSPEERESILQDSPAPMSASAAWLCFSAMQFVERPGTEGNWEIFESSQRIAWKTGTSFGFRDAWAIGVTPRYVVGVWAGNADGEGRPGLVGVRAAAPVLFDLFSRLPASSDWFEAPYNDMVQLQVCKKSGYRPLPACPVDTVWAPRGSSQVAGCPYHEWVQLDERRQWRVNASCAAAELRHRQSWFVLPPTEAHYYQLRHPDYQQLPPWREDCRGAEAEEQQMQLVYPKYPTKIYVPRNLDGSLSRTVFVVAHRHPEQRIYWHIDEEYLGQTQHFHSFELAPEAGAHTLTLVDEAGVRLEQQFEIVARER
jgi:penicillin-binding protein 1C